MLFKSLICFRGFDRGWRHLAISVAAYLLLMLVWLLFGNGYFIWLPGSLLAVVVIASALRRVRDAGRPLAMAMTPILPWLLVLTALSTAASSTGVYINVGLVLAALLHLGLAFLPAVSGKGAANRRSYIQGYSGPVNLSPKSRGYRVEPTLGGASAAPVNIMASTEVQAAPAFIEPSEPRFAAESESLNDIEPRTDSVWQDEPQTGSLSALLASWRDAGAEGLQQAWHYRKLLGGFTLILLVLAVAIVWWLSPAAPVDATPPTAALASANDNSARDTIKLPDHFDLSLQGDVLSLSWLGDTLTPGIIWDLASAKGDKHCAELVFNDDSRFRPMQVSIVNGNGRVEARFSPLDTKALINNVALRGSIKLCGYDFSLKGSQAALQADTAFSRYLD